MLEDLRSRATGLGVDAVPTLYRRGPVMSIQLNPAILNEDPRETAETINMVLGCGRNVGAEEGRDHVSMQRVR